MSIIMRATLHDHAPNTYYGQWPGRKAAVCGPRSRRPLPMMSSLRASDWDLSRSGARFPRESLAAALEISVSTKRKICAPGEGALPATTPPLTASLNSTLTVAAQDELRETAHQDAFLAQQRHDLELREAPAECLEHQLGLEVGEAEPAQVCIPAPNASGGSPGAAGRAGRPPGRSGIAVGRAQPKPTVWPWRIAAPWKVRSSSA